MCGRYAMFGPVKTSRAARLALDQMEIDLESVLNQREPQYNVAPTQKAPILAYAEGAYAIKATRWGLIPSWAKDEKIGAKLINARAETVAEKPSIMAAALEERAASLAHVVISYQPERSGMVSTVRTSRTE